ncbi:MAG TPA: UDP-N-acetylglucosamine 2-epimerase (non-hydrolyzing) [Solirubrobacteraceae bacterium]|jgi:UDP-N-acetylglucosamine 2-epimerase (non-hydrolysing)
MRTYLYVVGTRPNFMKTGPVLAVMRRRAPEDRHVLVHTGQHYDDAMSRVFFEDLELPAPDHYLGVGSGAPAAQTARMMEAIEALLLEDRPDMVIVPGDVNSTLAAGIAAAKHLIPVAHIESGLRSFDRTMPEELNRVLTDQLSDLLLTHSPEARDNLLREGIDPARIHFVGNTMIDTLVKLRHRADEGILERNGISDDYVLVTLHRPALVDGELLAPTLRELDALGQDFEVVFPVHPRTAAAIEQMDERFDNVRLLPPASYLEFLALQARATAVLTDSGGVQEETTYLGVPCFTLRDNTERPVTITQGTNVLLGLRPERIREIPRLLAEHRERDRRVPEGWDGHAAERVADLLGLAVADGARIGVS